MRDTGLLVLSTTLILGSATAQPPQPSLTGWTTSTVALQGSPAPAEEAQPQRFEDEEDFAELELEELMQIRVTSVAGRPEPLLDMPAAVFVVTDEDVRRTGSRSIAESLRMVPGVTVARITPSAWAISVRGFTDRFANKLLVLIDGRTVYDPLFSGVFWHVQDVLMEDLDRIEVIRGPGATLWGANAVNGVINVVTKSAKESQGVYVTGGGGNFEQGFAAFRYGDHNEDDNVFYRVYGKYDNSGSYDNITGWCNVSSVNFLGTTCRAGCRLPPVAVATCRAVRPGLTYEERRVIQSPFPSTQRERRSDDPPTPWYRTG